MKSMFCLFSVEALQNCIISSCSRLGDLNNCEMSHKRTRFSSVFLIKPVRWCKAALFLICYFRYEQPSGYRPAPLDLSEVFLSSEQEEVVSLLAENDHNAWARERIRQGWTYGSQQVSSAHDPHWAPPTNMHWEMNKVAQSIVMRLIQDCAQIV